MSGGTVTTRDSQSVILSTVDLLAVTAWGITQDPRAIITPRLDTEEQHLTKLPPLGKRYSVEVVVATFALADQLTEHLARSFHLNITVPPGPALPDYIFQDAKIAGPVAASPAGDGSSEWVVRFPIQAGARP